MSSGCLKLSTKLILVAIVLNFSTFAQPAMKKEGYNQLLYPNGKIASEGITVDGKPDGFWKNYYESGKIKSAGNRKNFQLDGIWKFYNEDSTLSSEISYQNDTKNGFTWTYNDGILAVKNYFVDNLKQGEGFEFYESGEIKTKVNYLDDLKDGEGFEYAKDGRIIALLKYNKDLLAYRDEINRFNSDNEKQGKWIEFHENGINRLVGGYLEGKKNGIFKEYDKKGKLIAIYKYDNDELSEHSSDVDVLEERKSYHPNGRVKTITTYRDGKIQGFIKEFDLNGKLINCEKYDQDIKLAEGLVDSLGREQGPWKFFFETGELRAEGEYLDAKKWAVWKYYYRNGKLEQQGFYKKDLPDGKWLWYYENSKIHREENYKNGKEDGPTEEYDRLGYLVLKGKYIDGKRTGPWYYYVGDNLEEGKYRDGNKEGLWVSYYDEEKTQKSFEGSYIDGVEDGLHTYYFPNGIIKETRNYQVGMRTGKWIVNSENGLPYSISEYKNGQLVRVNGVSVKDKLTKQEQNEGRKRKK